MIQAKLENDIFSEFELIYKDGAFYKNQDLSKKLDIETNDPHFKMLQFYVDYSLNKQTHFHHEHIIFDKVDPSQVFYRNIQFNFKGEGFIEINFEKARNINQSILGSSFSIFESSTDAIIITDAGTAGNTDQRIIYANPSYLEGSQYRLKDIIGRSPKILQGLKTEKEAKDTIREKIASWKTVCQRITNYRNDETAFVVELNMTPIKNTAGWYTHWISTQKDITKLAYDQEKMKLLEKTGDIGFWSVNAQNTRVIWSHHLYTLHNKEFLNADMSLLRWMSFYPAQTQSELNELFFKCLESGIPFDKEFNISSDASNSKWLRFQGKPLYDEAGQISEIFGTAQNITETQKKKENLELILDNISEGYWDWYIADDFEYMSPSFWKMLGVDYKTKKHHPSEWQKLIHPDDLSIAFDNFEKHVQTKGIHPFDQEVRYMHADGEYIWIQCKGRVIEWDGDKPVRMVGSHADIQKRKMAEFEAEEQKKNAMLQSRLASAGALSAGVGHEINNPLTVITGNMKILKKILESDIKAESSIKRIEKALSRIGGIAAKLRKFSDKDLAQQEFEIRTIARDSYTVAKNAYKRLGVNFRYISQSNKRHKITGTRPEIQQAFFSLIDNAVEAVKNLEDPEVNIIFGLDNKDRIYLGVEDNGPGIPEENLDKIFDAFYTTKVVGEGAGLGLSIAKTIVEKHGGRIKYCPSDLGGAKFMIYLDKIKGSENEAA